MRYCRNRRRLGRSLDGIVVTQTLWCLRPLRKHLADSDVARAHELCSVARERVGLSYHWSVAVTYATCRQLPRRTGERTDALHLPLRRRFQRQTKGCPSMLHSPASALSQSIEETASLMNRSLLLESARSACGFR